MRVLFEGGPLDGRMFSIPDDRKTWEAWPVLPPGVLYSEANRHPPEVGETVQLVRYKIQLVGGRADIDAMGVLA